MSFGDSVRRGFTLVRTFEGSDTRAEFWPYCAVVLGTWTVASNVFFMVVFVVTSVMSTDRLERPWPFIALTVVVAVVAVILLAAAVTRRLHDRGHSGSWALVPLALACSGVVIVLILAVTFDDDTGPGLFLVGFANNLVYFATMIVLTVQLALPSVDRRA